MVLSVQSTSLGIKGGYPRNQPVNADECRQLELCFSTWDSEYERIDGYGRTRTNDRVREKSERPKESSSHWILRFLV